MSLDPQSNALCTFLELKCQVASLSKYWQYWYRLKSRLTTVVEAN